MTPTLSIIVAIYNRDKELFELLTSLSKQSDGDFEVIIVDDGSQISLDKTIKHFENILDIHFYRKTNSGPGLTRNYGAKRAKNDWLIFLDSDVIVESDYISEVKKHIQESDCDAFGGADKAHRGFNLMQKAISYAMTSLLTTGGIRGNKKSISKFQPRSFNMGVKRNVFEQVGGFSEMRVGEDPDLSMTLWEKGFKTQFFDRIAVYHKRRTDFGRFSKQVYQFGCARPILNQRHPQYVKFSFAFPSLFLIGYVLGIIAYFGFHNGFILALYGFYILLLFTHALLVTKNVSIASYAIVASFVQFFSYGYGFLKSWILLNVFKQAPEKAFPHHFYH